MAWIKEYKCELYKAMGDTIVTFFGLLKRILKLYFLIIKLKTIWVAKKIKATLPKRF